MSAQQRVVLNQDLQDFEDYARSWEQFNLERAAA
jgi:hypothetical protein